MPTLGEVIGAFLSDVAQARVRADLEAVRLAQAYSADPIMKHLSIPRVRLPEVVIDLPVMVADISQPPDRATGRALEPPTATEISKAVRSALTKSGLRLPRADSARVIAVAVERAKTLFAEGNRGLLSPTRAAAQVTEAVVEAVQATAKGAAAAPGLGGLPEAASLALTDLLIGKSISLSVDVLVGADQLKERSDGGGNIVRLRLTVTEDAYEIIERDDGQGFLLTPE